MFDAPYGSSEHLLQGVTQLYCTSDGTTRTLFPQKAKVGTLLQNVSVTCGVDSDLKIEGSAYRKFGRVF